MNNKYLDVFKEAVSKLLGEEIDIGDTEKILIPVTVKDDLSLDEYEKGEPVLQEKWIEYKKIISDAVKTLRPNKEVTNDELDDVFEVSNFDIKYNDPHHVVVSFRIHSAVAEDYKNSDIATEAEGAIISDVMEQFGGNVYDPEEPITDEPDIDDSEDVM